MAHLVKKYQPDAIILMGSRARGTAENTSDWDIIVYTNDEHKGGFFNFQKQILDVTFKPLPHDSWLTIHYGPVYPATVLYDASKGVLDRLLKKTEAAYQKGPLLLYHDGCAERVKKLRQQYFKIKRHEIRHDVQYYYAGIFYEFAIRVWFEQQNIWPLPPAEGLPFIEKSDPLYWRFLNSFTCADSRECSKLALSILKRIELLKKS